MSPPTEFSSHCVHIDTTNFSVTGAYESNLNMGQHTFWISRVPATLKEAQ